jgi:hypothetical protein
VSLTPTDVKPTQVTFDVPMAAVAGQTSVDVVIRSGGAKGTASNAFSVKVIP